MNDFESSSSREILDMDDGEAAVAGLEGDRAAASQMHGLEEVADFSREALGGVETVDEKDRGQNDTMPGASRELNQSLARLEMNTIEVKHFLDSIDQRISRMEPRLDGMSGTKDAVSGRSSDRGTEAEPFASVASTASSAQGSSAEYQETVASEPVSRAEAGERRRRVVAVDVERRRMSHAGEADGEDERPWSFDEVVALLRRRWVLLGSTAVLTLLLLVLLNARSRPQAGADAFQAGVTASGPKAMQVPGSALPKNSAGIPWGSAEPQGQVGRGATVEQGVKAPGYASPGAPQAVPESTPQGESATQASVESVASGGAGTVPVGGSVAPDAAGGSGGASQPAAVGPARAPEDAVTASTDVASRAGSLPARRIKVSSGVMAGNLLYSPQPAYPKGLASLFHPKGEVVMQAIISRHGRVENLNVISGHLLLRGAAKDAVRTWRYRPYVVNGTPVEVATIVSVEFER